MFFILSKILNFLTNPLVLVALCFILSFFVKKARLRKVFFWLALALLWFFSNDFIANEAMMAWEIEPTPFMEVKKSYDWGIVLTGVTSNDQEPGDRVYFHHGADRVVHTVELYKRGLIKKIIISGGSGRLVTKARKEADELFQVMQLMGVPKEAMLVENESRNTHESAVAVKKILEHQPGTSVLLITSAFHLRRSAGCFRKAGLPVDVFSTDFYSHPRYFTPDVFLIPKADAFLIWQKLLKEWTGMVAYWVAGYV